MYRINIMWKEGFSTVTFCDEFSCNWNKLTIVNGLHTDTINIDRITYMMVDKE